MNIKTLKTVLQVGGLVISFIGTLLDAKIQYMDTEKAVDKYMNQYLDNAVSMAIEDSITEGIIDTTASTVE